MTLQRRILLGTGGALAGAGLLRSAWAQTAATNPVPMAAPDEARLIAREAYLYFYPLVTMEMTRRQVTNIEAGRMPGRGPMNSFVHIRAYPGAEFREVVRPNFDTLYSVAWLDLTRGPMVVSTPDTSGRYYLLQMLDMWSDSFAVPGQRTSGTQAAEFAVVPRGWTGTLPAGLRRIDAPTPYVWIVGRTQTNGPSDYPAVHQVQDGLRITSLARRGQPALPPSVTIDPGVDMRTPPKVQVDTMQPAAYFGMAAELMRLHPPHDSDWSLVARLARIGIVPGQGFDPQALSPALRQALGEGAADGARLMVEKLPTIARVVRGWQMNTDTIGVYGNSYLQRAIIAQLGLGANPPEDAVYPLSIADAQGNPLTGEGRYTMHFEKAELPPVNAFWSLTLYDADGFQVANPLNRFAIGDRDTLTYNADGSLDLHIQHEDPGAEKRPNWLPSPPRGPISLAMRLYAPKAAVLNGSWAPPAIQKL